MRALVMTTAGKSTLAWIAFGCMATAGVEAAGRDWYTLAIDGQRVGYAYRERVASAHGSLSREVVHIEVTQVRQRSAVERRVELTRDAAERPLRMTVVSDAGTERSRWHKDFPAGTSNDALLPIATDRLEETFMGKRLTWTPCAAACDARIETPFDPMES